MSTEVLAVTSTRSLRLMLDLHSEGERIAGRLRDEHGNEWPFSSWLGLLTLIERMRASASSVKDETGRREMFARKSRRGESK